jgi:hypothetical protein
VCLLHFLFFRLYSPDFVAVFTSGFREGSPVVLSCLLPPVPSTSPSPWLNDDDSLEWLPSTWLNKYGIETTTNSAISTLDSDTEAGSEIAEAESIDAGQLLKSSSGKYRGQGHRFRVRRLLLLASIGILTSLLPSYTTYRAMLYWLYTNEIRFAPPASDFTVHLVSSQTSYTSDNPSSSSTATETPKHDLSRRGFLLHHRKKPVDEKPSKVEPASPHAIYKLADKLDLDELKKLAQEAILSGFSVENVGLFTLSSRRRGTDLDGGPYRSSTNSYRPSPITTTRSRPPRSTSPSSTGFVSLSLSHAFPLFPPSSA